MLRIREIREQKGITLRILAEQTGLSRSSLSDLEQNKKIPTVKELEAIAKALSVNEKDLWRD